METQTSVVSESKDNTLVIPTDLTPHLKRNALLIITSAQQHGTISTREISAMLQPGVVPDRYRLKTTLGLLDDFLAKVGLSLARGKVDLEKRDLPLPTFVNRTAVNIQFRPISNRDLELLSSIKLDGGGSDYDELALYRDVINRFPLLDHAQTIELFKKRAEGDLEAHYRLILHNLKLVFHWAYKSRGRGLDLPDLVQEGILGLLRAIEKFEWRKGFTLGTYASGWIRSLIQRAIIDKGRTIRLPAHFAEKHQALKRITETLKKELGRDPTLEEVSARADLPAKFVSKLFQVSSASETGSIDAPLSDTEGSSDGYSVIEDSNTVSPLSIIEAKETLEEVAGEIRTLLIDLSTIFRLDSRNREIFLMRYGLSGTFFARPTLEVVGKKYGVTRERIRQIVEEVWSRLNFAGIKRDERWLIAKMNQIEELESVTGVFTKI